MPIPEVLNKTIPHFSYKQISDRLELYIYKKSLQQNSFAEDVKKGLTSTPKALLPKYFYDEKGSLLFEEICKTEDYYPTRTEESILKTYSNEIAEKCNKEVISELGSGSSYKTGYLLEAFLKQKPGLKYIPLDVSTILIESSEKLIEKYDGLYITGIIAEYLKGFKIVKEAEPRDKLVIFLGSSIGNFTFEYSIKFLKAITKEMNPGDMFLIGFDLKKDEEVLRKAYNDSEGVTALFNLNLLERINRELDADFDVSKFEHMAEFNREKSRMEMYLISKEEQNINIKGINETVHFDNGERIHTENSYKYNDDMIEELAAASGLRWIKTWNDDKRYFALSLFEKK
jgi:dimethylhistidine N-methyltransferase